MTKYITVKLTEDQARYLRNLVDEDVERNSMEMPSDEIAFCTRVRNKLVFTKS